MDFTPINTQEEFDQRVQELYGDVKDLQGKITTLTGERDGHAATITQLQGQIKGHEIAALKHKVAHELGIPFEMASRLAGDTEEDIRKDAAVVAKFITAPYEPAPLYYNEPAGTSATDAALEKMLNEMEGE